MPAVRDRRRISRAVRDAVVHRRQAGRIRESEIRDLHGCGTPREYRQTVAVRVPGEVHENIDAVGLDLLGERIVRELPHLPPDVRAGSEALGHGILMPRIAVEDILEGTTIARARDGLKKLRHRVRAEIAGNETDTQSPPSQVPTRRGLYLFRVLHRKKRAPLADRLGNLLGSHLI